MVKLHEFPDQDELVVCTVEVVKNFGVNVSLDEYPGKYGFIHISEVAAGWVKYIRDFVREKQKIVCKVLRIRPEREQIDLSLKRVNEHQRRDTIQAWKNEQKAERLMDIVAQRMGKSIAECRKEFLQDILEVYDDLFPAFEQAAMNPDLFREELPGDPGETPEWMRHFIDVARENISLPYIHVHGFVDLSTNSKNGIEDIRGALETAMDAGDENFEITVRYLGAPTSRIVVKAFDYKEAEEVLRMAGTKAVEYIEDHGGTGRFYKEKTK